MGHGGSSDVDGESEPPALFAMRYNVIASQHRIESYFSFGDARTGFFSRSWWASELARASKAMKFLNWFLEAKPRNIRKS